MCLEHARQEVKEMVLLPSYISFNYFVAESVDQDSEVVWELAHHSTVSLCILEKSQATSIYTTSYESLTRFRKLLGNGPK